MNYVTNPTSPPLDPTTARALAHAIDTAMYNREVFFPIDISNAVKLQGYASVPPSNFGTHTQMREEIAVVAPALARTHNYEWTFVDVDDSRQQATLYFPSGTPVATLQAHVNRRVTALIPVEVWAAQRSQQGSGIQRQATLPVQPDASTQPDTATQAIDPAPAIAAQIADSVKRLGQHIIDQLKLKP